MPPRHQTPPHTGLTRPTRQPIGKVSNCDYKIWHLSPGRTYDLKNRPTCGYLRSIFSGFADGDLCNGANCASSM